MRKFQLIGIALALTIPASPCHSQQQLLPPEQAFRIQSIQIDPRAVVFNFSMRPGYILYYERFAFSGAEIERIELPAPQSKFDPALGKTVQFYRDSVRAMVVLRSSANRSLLVATAQGCAQHMGVCYPPVSAAHRLQ
jgi:thiol:disulfide interchange protein DsbD